MTDLLKSAKQYLKAGISVIVTDNTKRSLKPWKQYQKELIAPAQLEEELKAPRAAGIAIVCGSVSGGLEVIDVDLKYDLSGNLWDRLVSQLKEAGLYELLKVAKTKSGGYHLYYKCEVIEGNQKLAMRQPTAEEKKENPQIKHMVLIETRGEGGYVIAPPASGYTWVGGRVNILSIDQRECLMEICRSFNEVFVYAPAPAQTLR